MIMIMIMTPMRPWIFPRKLPKTGINKGGCGFVCDSFVCAYVDDTLTLSLFLPYDMQSHPSILDGYRENLVTYISCLEKSYLIYIDNQICYVWTMFKRKILLSFQR